MSKSESNQRHSGWIGEKKNVQVRITPTPFREKWKFRRKKKNQSMNQTNAIQIFWKKSIAILPIEGLVSTDRSMVAALLNTTPRPVTKSSANESTPRPWTCMVLYFGHNWSYSYQLLVPFSGVFFRIDSIRENRVSILYSDLPRTGERKYRRLFSKKN